MNVHEEEDDPRLKVASDVVHDQAFSHVVDLDVGTTARLDRLVLLLMICNPHHVCLDGFVRIPSIVLTIDGGEELEERVSARKRQTSGELILTERMLASTMSSRSQMFSANVISSLSSLDPAHPELTNEEYVNPQLLKLFADLRPRLPRPVLPSRVKTTNQRQPSRCPPFPQLTFAS
jgi:hypothetical protein